MPTYSVNRAPKMGEVKRALRLAGLLLHSGVAKDADDNMREVLTRKLKDLRDNYAASEAEWPEIVREGGEIEVDVATVAIAGMSITGRKQVKIQLSDENVDQLFDASGRKLATGEGLHRSYWKRYHDHQRPNIAKLELFAVVRHPEALSQMEELASQEFKSLWDKYKSNIRLLRPGERARFDALMQASGKPAQGDWNLPNKIVEKKDGSAWKHHLYCNTEGDFFGKVNEWEKDILEEAMKEEGFVAWLRNLPRRGWGLCIPYELGGTKPFYPDFIVIRRKDAAFEVDILEPHDDSRTDTWAKAKGLATFADQHGTSFGRLIIARKKGNQFQKADMNDRGTRQKARNMQSNNELESLFRSSQ